MARTAWNKTDEALTAARRHVLAGETREALAAIDLARDTLAQIRPETGKRTPYAV